MSNSVCRYCGLPKYYHTDFGWEKHTKETGIDPNSPFITKPKGDSV